MENIYNGSLGHRCFRLTTSAVHLFFDTGDKNGKIIKIIWVALWLRQDHRKGVSWLLSMVKFNHYLKTKTFSSEGSTITFNYFGKKIYAEALIILKKTFNAIKLSYRNEANSSWNLLLNGCRQFYLFCGLFSLVLSFIQVNYVHQMKYQAKIETKILEIGLLKPQLIAKLKA